MILCLLGIKLFRSCICWFCPEEKTILFLLLVLWWIFRLASTGIQKNPPKSQRSFLFRRPNHPVHYLCLVHSAESEHFRQSVISSSCHGTLVMQTLALRLRMAFLRTLGLFVGLPFFRSLDWAKKYLVIAAKEIDVHISHICLPSHVNFMLSC